MITLVCWTCGKRHDIEEDIRTIRFGFELAALALQIKWQAYHDDPRGRILVFCQDSCVEKARKRNGEFRLRPPKLVRSST